MLHYLIHGVGVGVCLGFSATEKAVRIEGRERDRNEHILAIVKCKAKYTLYQESVFISKNSLQSLSKLKKSN